MPNGTHTILFAELGCICVPSFRCVAPSFFLAKAPILAFLKERSVCPYRHAHGVPLVTLILNVFGFVGLEKLVDED